MIEDEIIERAVREHENIIDAVWWAIQEERESCAKSCEEVMRKYKVDATLDPEASKAGAVSAEKCALWIRNRL